MKDAVEILKGKKFIKNEIEKRLDSKTCIEIWLLAQKRLEDMLEDYKGLPEGVQAHTHAFIFPSMFQLYFEKTYIIVVPTFKETLVHRHNMLHVFFGDELLQEHGQELSPLKKFAFRHLGRHLMNRNVKKIRNYK